MRARRVSGLALTLLAGCGAATSNTSHEHHAHHGAGPVAGRIASVPPPPLPSGALDPQRGRQIGAEYEAYLSPHQEPDEEENTPTLVPAQFRATTPSMNRAAREAAGHRGHGRVRFSRDLSRAYIDVRVEGIDPSTVNMFHIHCGRPGILGPILVDFALATNVQQNLADGVFSVEITNEHITATTAQGHGPLGALTMGCVIPSPTLNGLGPVRVSTVAGMAQIAAEGELYFNLHTTGQSYFGDIRGQILRPEAP